MMPPRPTHTTGMPTATRADSPTFTAALGAQLVLAHDRLRRRRRRRQAGFAVAAVAVLALFMTASLSALRPEAAAADPISVTQQPDGSRTITIEEAGALPETLQAALLAANIDNVTHGVPTGPSRVGTIIAISFDGAAQALAPRDDPRSFRLPVDFHGTIDLTVGQPAAPGQVYAQPSDVFGPGEPLAGYARPDSATEVITAATKKQLRITILGNDGQPLGAERVPSTAKVAIAQMTSSRDLLLRLAG